MPPARIGELTRFAKGSKLFRNMTVHIGILGGGVSDTHSRAAAQIDGVSIAALSEVNPRAFQEKP